MQKKTKNDFQKKKHAQKAKMHGPQKYSLKKACGEYCGFTLRQVLF